MIDVAIVSDYAYAAGGITSFVETLAVLSEGRAASRLIIWENAVTRALRETRWKDVFASITLVEAGDLTEAIGELANADVVFVQTSWRVRAMAFAVAAWCESTGVPLITALHTSSHSAPGSPAEATHREWLEKIIAVSAHVVCVSEAVRRSIAPLADNFGTSISVIDNASRFAPRPASPFAQEPRHRVVSFIGRPTLSKGIEDFMAIAEALGELPIRFRCNTVDQDIPSEVARPTHVELSRNLGPSELIRFIDETSVLVAPYRHAEGRPLAVLEALALGTPVIGYDAPGVGELLRAHVQLVFPIGEASAIAELLKAWSRGELELPLPSETQSLAWKAAVDEYLRLFQAVAS